MLSRICLVQALMEKNTIKLLKALKIVLSYLSMSRQYLECREDELNELRHLLETNHRAVTKWKTNVVETAKVT